MADTEFTEIPLPEGANEARAVIMKLVEMANRGELLSLTAVGELTEGGKFYFTTANEDRYAVLGWILARTIDTTFTQEYIEDETGEEDQEDEEDGE